MNKLSLAAIVLISLNVMIGTGLFVNTVVFAHNAGPYGALIYALVGVVMFPLVVSFSRLLAIHEGGSFYEFAAPLHPAAGFVSLFAYFVAKMGSAAVGIHVFVTLMQKAFPILHIVHPLVLDCLIVALFSVLNMANLRTGQRIQYGFLILKFIPILFAILSGIYLFKGTPVALGTIPFTGIIGSIPFALFAFAGFEVCCSLSRNVENSQYNAPRAVIISYGLGVLITVLYQLMFYGALGSVLGELGGYAQMFPVLVDKVLPCCTKVKSMLSALLPIGIATSALGAAYGIMYSNIWNLFRLAYRDYVPFSKRLSALNNNGIPSFIVVIEALLVIAYILFSHGNQVPLQQIGSFGTSVTYTLSVLALVVYNRKHGKKLDIFPVLGCFSCLLLVGSFVKNVALYGAFPILIFSMLVVLGTATFLLRRRRVRAV